MQYNNAGSFAATSQLTVSGADLFLGGDFYVSGSQINLGNGLSATATISGIYSRLGFGSTTPYGQISIEADNTDIYGVGSNTPIFVIGDSGSSSPVFYVSGRSSGDNPLIGIGTDTPSVALEVRGDGIFDGNLNIAATSTAGAFNATNTIYVASSSPTVNSNLVVSGSAYIDSLGIGAATTSPGGLLVKGSADILAGLVVRGSGTDVAPLLFAQDNVGIASTAPYGRFSLEIDSFVDDVTPAFVIGDSGTSAPQVLVDYQGRVGIAQREPRYTLHLGAIATSTNVSQPLSIPPILAFSSTNTPSSTYGGYWSKLGGDGTGNETGSGWADSTYEKVLSMTSYNGKLYAGIGSSTAGEGEVWEYNGSTWNQIGGDGVNSSWADSTYESVLSMTSYNGK
ncbi:MAG: hypothetical protein AAB642_03965, partial [Patescibacteria group bacterium]